jgi:hypothetical protein
MDGLRVHGHRWGGVVTDPARIQWLYEASEFEADGGTYAFEAMPKPDDPVLRAAIAVIRERGMYSEISVVPADLVDVITLVLAASDGTGGAT